MAPADDRLTVLLRTFREQASAGAPGWTDSNQSDPGVTLVELFAFLAEQLYSRSADLPASARTEAARIGLQLARLDPDRAAAFPLDPATGSVRFGDGTAGRRPVEDAHLSGSMRTGGGAAGAVSQGPAQLERPTYFTGQLLTADDLGLEQAYVREKFRRIHLAAFDTGVVTGLHVTVDDTGDTPSIVVSPGSALDAEGELIVVDAEVRCPLPPSTEDQLVLLRYVERVSAFALAGGDASADSTSLSHPSRVVEGAALSIADSMDDGAVLLATLTHSGDGWAASAPAESPE